ncbi:unnamed protein product [Adineta steineri]|uniref:Uncharacterized protein n=1 Tax=Adineta steineri TaxID=433720 RepID=A0A816CR23_9BILA|nr:unnamed protein product [Adineta steineri]CAF1624367.1 unnamed protein product [Adineta steineri]
MMEQIHIRSRDKQNSIHHLRSLKPQVTKLSRHHHIRRSYNNQHGNQLKNKSQTIRTKRHVSLVSDSLTIHPYHQKQKKNSLVTVKSIKNSRIFVYPSSIITNDKYESPVSQVN